MAKAGDKARSPSWADIAKAHMQPSVAAIPSTVRDFCRLQKGSLEQLPAPPAPKAPERHGRYPVSIAPTPVNGTTVLEYEMAPMMSTLAFSAGFPGKGALSSCADAQACLPIAAEGAGESLPKHAPLKVGDCTIVVHHAADSPSVLKILEMLRSDLPGARLCTNTLSELVVELPTVEWQVCVCIAAAREVGNLKTIASGITMTDRKALAGAITRLIDEAAATLPRGNAFVENFITEFYRGCPHLAPATGEKEGPLPDDAHTNGYKQDVPDAQDNPSAAPEPNTPAEAHQHTSTDTQDEGVEIPGPATVREEPKSAASSEKGTKPTPAETADPSPTNLPVAKPNETSAAQHPKQSKPVLGAPPMTTAKTERRTNRTHALSQRMKDMRKETAKRDPASPLGQRASRTSRH